MILRDCSARACWMGRADDTGSQLLYKNITMEMDRLLLAIGAEKQLLPLGCTFDIGKYFAYYFLCFLVRYT